MHKMVYCKITFNLNYLNFGINQRYFQRMLAAVTLTIPCCKPFKCSECTSEPTSKRLCSNSNQPFLYLGISKLQTGPKSLPCKIVTLMRWGVAAWLSSQWAELLGCSCTGPALSSQVKVGVPWNSLFILKMTVRRVTLSLCRSIDCLL